jgi:hypothetical protein
VVVDAPRGYAFEFGGKLARRQRPVTEEGLDDPQAHRVQEEIRTRHAVKRSPTLMKMLMFMKME